VVEQVEVRHAAEVQAVVDLEWDAPAAPVA
jgi:hypothetical protein